MILKRALILCLFFIQQIGINFIFFLIRIPLLPFSLFYYIIIKIRNYFYDKKFIKIKKLPRPVISIGNITIGGSGKTPLVLELLNQFDHACVLTRGYKSEITKQKLYPAFVPDGLSPKKFGDEPSLIKTKNINVNVIIDPNRYRGGEFALESIPNIKFFILDDGFQHRQLHRDLDLLVFDMDAFMKLDFLSKIISFSQMLPTGKFREPLSSLKRADFIILSKWSYINSKLLDETVLNIKKLNSEVHYADSKIIEIKNLKGQQITIGPVLLFSGLGQPKFFEQDIKSGFNGLVVMEHVIFSDHYDYKIKDIKFLIKKAQSINASLVCSEKDFIKIKSLHENIGRTIDPTIDPNLYLNSDINQIYFACQKLKLPEVLLNKILNVKVKSID